MGLIIIELYSRIDNVVNSIPPVNEPIIDPNDTNRVIAMIGIDTIKHIIPQIGDNIVKAAQPEAIPFPPWKLLNIGLMCPNIEDNPIIG
jgi:hypothetical protein